MTEKEKIEILEKIDRYIRGELNQEEIDELWKIFLKHPESYKWLETEIHLRSVIRKGKRPQFGPSSGGTSNSPSSTQSYKGWFYAAAAAVLLALGLQFFSLQQPESIPDLAVANIEMSHLLGADVMRSGFATTEDVDIAINKALATAYEGEAERAIEQFREILELSPPARERALVEMNLGILLYNNGMYESAGHHFESITENNQATDFQEEKAWWFLGNVYLNLNQALEAREAVFNAYSMDGRFQQAALSLLKKLDVKIGNIPPEGEPEQLGS